MENFRNEAGLDVLLQFRFRFKPCYILLFTALYVLEITLTVVFQIKNYQTFQNRPRYEAFYPIKSNGDQRSYLTVAKKGSGKNCGNYDDSADDIVYFVNNFPSFLEAFLYIYLVCLIVCFLLDISMRVVPRLMNLCRKGGEYSGEESPLSVTVMLLVFFYIPVYKVLLVGLNYPITSVVYDKCIDHGFDFTLNESFYYIIIVTGFSVCNGLIWIAMAAIMPNCWLKYVVLVIHFPGFVGAVLWGILIYGTSIDKEFVKPLVFCILLVIFYFIFSVFVVPFITFDYMLIPVTLSVIIRFILVLCFDKGPVVVGLS